MRELKVAWWKEVPNFGDALTPYLLEKLVDIKAIHSSNQEIEITTEFMGVGSYLEQVRPSYTGYIWGTGRMFPGDKIDLSNAKILALRGKLTKGSVVGNCDVLGDPGLLCKLFKPDVEVVHKIGVIPHWNDNDLQFEYSGHLIDIKQEIETVMREVASCETIISSSLHGIVLADAFGKPRYWKDTIKNPGNGFKFQDYQSIYDYSTIVPKVWHTASQKRIDEINEQLLTKLKGI
jgi:pyruvyltransferase